MRQHVGRPDLVRSLDAGGVTYDYISLAAAEESGLGPIARLPVSLRILLENMLVHQDGETVTDDQIRAVADWSRSPVPGREVAFRPLRILMPDSSGLPLLADLAAMRDAMARLGGRPEAINPAIPLDLVIDHSVVAERAGDADAFRLNMEREFERNAERYAFVKWAAKAYDALTAVPPGNGICHQVNLEQLAKVVATRPGTKRPFACAEVMVGMDSHTTMVNSLCTMGWGVGGIEAATAMLGQPIGLAVPEVIGCRLVGRLRPHVTTTDLALTVTQRLRARGVLGAFVEFFGDGLAGMTLPERATLSNMAPEYGATMAIFPVDRETVRYLETTGRSDAQIALVEAFAKAQGLWSDPHGPEPVFNDIVEIDLDRVEASAAGPRRPQDRVPLGRVGTSFRNHLTERGVEAAIVPEDGTLRHGDIVVAAITSCTNTSNPSVMIAAGLLARNAIARGLRTKPWVKASLAPGSRVVTDYLDAAGLTAPLDELGFNLVGYGCTTCMGNSGALAPDVEQEIRRNDLQTVAVLSGNRNFESRIHPLARANYLVSPPLVVAFALKGTVLGNLTDEPLGEDESGNPVHLAEIWPDDAEIREVAERFVGAPLFRARYAGGPSTPEQWDAIDTPGTSVFRWDPDSTFILRPPFFDGVRREPERTEDIHGARVLALLGDSVNTDHISPVSAIPTDSLAGRHLIDRGVPHERLSSYMARRVNHEVMTRGTFANLQLRNEMAPDRLGGFTRLYPEGTETTIYEAADAYRRDGIPTIVIAGADYGAGSSRDWAAKGPHLLGVRAIIAESFERIHRSNLIGMGVLPLQFPEGCNRKTLRLDGSERFDIEGLAQPSARSTIACRIMRRDGSVEQIDLLLRLDTDREVAWYCNGGVLPYVLRSFLADEDADGNAATAS